MLWPALLTVASLLLALTPGRADAALTAGQLATVAASPKPGAQLPTGLPLRDETGQTRTLEHWLGRRPALLILADTRCTQLCGPILSIAARALTGARLLPGQDFDLLVVGFNPKATAADSVAMRAAQLDGATALAHTALFLTGTAEGVTHLEMALGYTALFDRDAGRFAHPAQVFVVTPDGKLSRTLDGLALEPETTRLALVEAGRGQIGMFADRLRLLCYGLDPATGLFNAPVAAALRIGAALTLAGLGSLILLTVRRRAPASTGA